MSADRVLLERSIADFDYREPQLERAVLPSKADVYKAIAASSRIAVDDQGQYGSCTAHAMSYAFQLWSLRTGLLPLTRPSRLYWYNYSRILLGDSLQQDWGSTNEATRTALQQYGWVEESAFAYSSSNIKTRPSAALTAQGQKRKLTIGARVSYSYDINNNANLICAALASNKPVVCGILVYSSFMTQAVLRSGTVPMPNRQRERLLGGHAICLSGYDAASRRFSFRNSWGSSVGLNGTFTIPYDYIANPGLCGDIWAV
jgi:C1A family cysteine protease